MKQLAEEIARDIIGNNQELGKISDGITAEQDKGNEHIHITFEAPPERIQEVAFENIKRSINSEELKQTVTNQLFRLLNGVIKEPELKFLGDGLDSIIKIQTEFLSRKIERILEDFIFSDTFYIARVDNDNYLRKVLC